MIIQFTMLKYESVLSFRKGNISQRKPMSQGTGKQKLSFAMCLCLAVKQA